MHSHTACLDCLRRSWLLALAAPYIERERRSAGLLGFDNARLVATVAPLVSDQILARVASLTEQAMTEQLARSECWAVCQHDADYPCGLRDLADPPAALIGRGDPGLLVGVKPSDMVAIVGARRATSRGRNVARELAEEVAKTGTAVVSGLAFGIDYSAHRGALDVRGCTIAVLPCGPDQPYPKAHKTVWRRIGETGLVLSELPPGTFAWRWSFIARNRIVAALSHTTVVVEAAEHSGSLATAARAAALGRRVAAVPGPVDSRVSVGTNSLIAAGAALVRSAADLRLDDPPGSQREPADPADH